MSQSSYALFHYIIISSLSFPSLTSCPILAKWVVYANNFRITRHPRITCLSLPDIYENIPLLRHFPMNISTILQNMTGYIDRCVIPALPHICGLEVCIKIMIMRTIMIMDYNHEIMILIVIVTPLLITLITAEHNKAKQQQP